MRWEAVVLVIAVVVLLGVATRVWWWWSRRTQLARVAGWPRRREALGRSLRVLVSGRALPGMNPKKSNRTTGDLVIATSEAGEGRLVVASARGLLLDIGPGRGRPLRSARCTGPGRLVIEGDTPIGDGSAGAFRLEVTVDDAEGWASDLRPFTKAPLGVPRTDEAPQR